MTCGSLNTSEQSRWQTVEESLLASLRCQPLLIVIRPEQSDLEGEDSESPLLQQIADLHRCGLRHLEIAWADHPGWIDFVRRVRAVSPGVHLGAASVTTAAAVDAVELNHQEDSPRGRQLCTDVRHTNLQHKTPI